MITMNRAPWLWYAWAFLTAYGLMADRRWLLAAAVVAVAGMVRSAPAVSPRLSNASFRRPSNLLRGRPKRRSS